VARRESSSIEREKLICLAKLRMLGFRGVVEGLVACLKYKEEIILPRE
jgi:hypothetical protein